MSSARLLAPGSPFLYLLAIALGALLVTAFAPFGWYPLALIIPTLGIMGLHTAEPRQAARLGYLFGLGLYGAGVYWVYNSVHEFGQAPAAFAIALTLVFVLVLSLFTAAFAWLVSRFRLLSNSASALLAVPTLWVFIEWVRGWIFTGFPWLQLGYSQSDSPLGTSIAPLLGVLGVSWVLMLIAVSIAWLIMHRGCRSMIVGLVLATLLGGALGLQHWTWTEPAEKPLKVSLVQGNIAQENKWAEDWLLPTVYRYQDLTRERWGDDLIIWPEAALPGLYESFREPVFEPLAEEARQYGTDIITGMLYEKEGGIYNSVMSMGSKFTIYFKRHLVPFGEYIPFRNIISWLGDMVVIPNGDVARADEALMLEAAGQKIAASVCYEDAYGAEMSVLLPEANLLVNVSNDAWFGDSLAPHQHLQIARMRSIEFGRVMLRTTNTGVTAIIDHDGKILSQLPQFEVAVLSDEIYPRTGATPYAVTGNWVVVPLMMVMFCIGIFCLPKRSVSECE